MKELLMYQRQDSDILIPIFAETIHAGFESPGADYEEERIDLNAYVTNYPAATFYARVVGECMTGSGIFPDDILVVDRSLNPVNGDIVVGTMQGDFILRSYYKRKGIEYLMPDSPDFKPILRSEATTFEIWGVVPHSILNQRKRIADRISRFEHVLR